MTCDLCYRFIAMLEKSGQLLRNYTQNIDTLEQVAGIKRVVQCHGILKRPLEQLYNATFHFNTTLLQHTSDFVSAFAHTKVDRA